MEHNQVIKWARKSLAQAEKENKADGAFARAVREYLKDHDKKKSKS